MYTLMDQIPASILFNGSKKISKGFQWAPASLMGEARNTFLRGKGKAGRCDIHGLHVQFSGYIVTSSRHQPRSSNRTDIGSRYIGDSNETAPIWWVGSRGTGLEALNSKSAMENDIELNEFWNQSPMPGLILNPDDSTESALVSVSREEDGIIYATFERKNIHRRAADGKWPT